MVHRLDKPRNDARPQKKRGGSQKELIQALIDNDYKPFYEQHYKGKKSTMSKDEIFQEFLKEFSNKFSKNNDILKHLQALKGSDITFSDIKDQNLELKELLKDPRSFSEFFRGDKTEEQSINDVIATIANMIDGESTSPLDVLSANDFVNFLGVQWNGMQASVPKTAKVKTIDDCRKQIDSFFQSHGINLDDMPKSFAAQYVKQLAFDNYDPTEKAVVKASIDTIEKALQKDLSRAGKQTILDDYRQQFLSGDNENLNVFSNLQTLGNWKQKLEEFMRKHNFSDEERNLLLDIKLDNNEIRTAAQKIGRFTGQQVTSASSYDSRSDVYKTIFNKVTTKQVIRKLQEGESLVNAHLSKVGEFFNFPGSVNDFFADFKDLSSDELEKLAPQEFKKLTAIKEEYKAIGDAFYDKDSGNYHNPSILVQQEKLRRQMVDMERDVYLAAIAKKVHKQNPSLGQHAIHDVLTKLKNSKFDISQLSLDEKNLIVRMVARMHMSDIDVHNTVSMLGLDGTAYLKFVDDLFDLTKQSATIPTVQGPLTINFKRKDILGTPLKEGTSFSDFISLDNFPLHFEVAVDSSDLEIFFQETLGSTESGKTLFYDFNGRNGKTKFAESYKVDLVHSSGDVSYNDVYLSPYGSAGLDTMDPELTAQKAGAMYVYRGDPVSMPSGKREYVLDANGQPVVILPSEQSQYELHTKPSDKVLHINGGNVPRLLGAFALANMAKDPNRQIPELMNQFNKFEDGYHDLNKQYEYSLDENGNPIQRTKEDELLNQNPEQEFLNAFINKLEPKNNENLTLTPGVRLFVKGSESLSPSRPSGGYLWKQFVFQGYGSGKQGKTVKFKVHGCEYDLGSQEGKFVEFPMNEAMLERFLEIFGSETYKVTKDHPDYKNVLSSLMTSNTGHDFSMFEKLDQDGDSFSSAGEKITHFATSEDPIEGTGGKERQPVLYKVKIRDGKVHVEGDYLEALKDKEKNVIKNKKDQVEVAKINYSRVMDHASFMIRAAEKGLKPKTNKEAQDLESLKNTGSTNIQGPKRGLHFISPQAIGSFFGATIDKIKKQLSGIQDKYAANLTEYLVGDKKLYAMLGKICPNRLINFNEFQGEYDAGLGDMVFAKIQSVTDGFSKLHHSDVIGSTSNPKAIIGVMMKSKNSKGNLSYEDRITAAGSLLWMLEKGHGPYGRGMKDFPVGSWVQALYGEQMYQKFKLFYEKEKSALLNAADLDRAMDKLNRLETKFLVDNIIGGEFNVDLKGDYDLKRFFSRKFANDLSGKADSYYYKASETHKEEFTRLEKESFEVIEEEMSGNIKGNRINAAIGALKALANNAKNSEHYRKVNMYLTMMMMSGMLSRETFQGVRYELQTIARSSGIVLSTWTADPQQEKKVSAVLNLITNGAFKSPALHPDATTAIDRSTNMDAFYNEFSKAWSANQEKIVNFLSYKNRELNNGKPQDLISLAGTVNEYNGKPIDSATKEYLKELKKALLESSSGTDIDNDLRNGVLINNNPFVTSPAIFRLYSGISEDGRGFSGGKADPKHQRMASGLWNAVSSESKKTFQTPFNVMLERDKLVFYTQKFFSMFGSFYGQKEGLFARIISTIKHNPKALKDKEAIIRFFLKGWMAQSTQRGIPPELNTALEAYLPFFVKNLGNLDAGIMSEALGPDAGMYNSPLTYTTGFDKYLELKKERRVQNPAEQEDWLEYSMGELERNYYRKTSESLWDKVSGKQGGSASSDYDVKQPYSAPRVTKDNYKQLKQNNIERTNSQIIERPLNQSGAVYADTIEQLPREESSFLENEYPYLIEADGTLSEDVYEVLGNQFQRRYHPMSQRPGQAGLRGMGR